MNPFPETLDPPLQWLNIGKLPDMTQIILTVTLRFKTEPSELDWLKVYDMTR